MEKIDLAVVFYEKEVELLKLLSKSIEIYCSTDLVDKLYFINNSVDVVAGRKAFEKHVKPLFNKFAHCLKVIDAIDFGIDYTKGADPYTAQQALKLEFSAITDKSHYLVLDAKNHFIRSLESTDLFSKFGKPISHHQLHGGYLKTCLGESCNYLGVNVDLTQPVLPTVTPYLLVTDIVRRLSSYVHEREGHGFYKLIDKNNRITEFLLYCAFIMQEKSINEVYETGNKPYATLFAKWPETESDIQRVLQSTSSPDVWMFSIHSRRFDQLKPNEAQFISNLWVERQLFSSIDAANDFIDSQKSKPVAQSITPVSATGDGKVVIGRNGRLFIANDSNEVIKQHKGEKLLTHKQALTWKRLLECRKAVCNTKGITYQMMIVPDAHAVHRDELPLLDGQSENRPVKQVLDALYDSSYINYPLEELKTASVGGEAYHPVDSHYTGYGAYCCYKALLENLKMKLFVLQEDDVETTTKTSSGDLGEKFNPPMTAEYSECVVKKANAKKIWNNQVTNRGHMSVWVNSDKTKPTCILFTDSYGWKIQRFLAESFSKLYIIHSPLLELDAIECFQPDFVFTLMAERFLIYPPKDLFDKPAMDFANEKGGDVKSYDEIALVAGS